MTRPPKQWETQGSKPVCAGLVAANITGTTLEEFKAWYGADGHFHTSKVLEYLSRHGIVVGYHVNELYKMVDESGKLISYRIQAELNQPAFVAAHIVGTPPDAANHACYWDGERLWDPHFETPVDGLEGYDVTSWTPLYFEDRALFGVPLTINRL